jgi:cathepsin D
MGFMSISEYNANPVFQTLIADGQTSDSVFAFKLSQSGAELSVGGTDSSLYSGDFTYAKVEKEVYMFLYMHRDQSTDRFSRVTGRSLLTL